MTAASYTPDTEIAEELDECPHSYEFLETLPSQEPDVYTELWGCIHCSHERVLTHHVGVHD